MTNVQQNLTTTLPQGIGSVVWKTRQKVMIHVRLLARRRRCPRINKVRTYRFGSRLHAVRPPCICHEFHDEQEMNFSHWPAQNYYLLIVIWERAVGLKPPPTPPPQPPTPPPPPPLLPSLPRPRAPPSLFSGRPPATDSIFAQTRH